MTAAASAHRGPANNAVLPHGQRNYTLIRDQVMKLLNAAGFRIPDGERTAQLSIAGDRAEINQIPWSIDHRLRPPSAIRTREVHQLWIGYFLRFTERPRRIEGHQRR